MGKQKGEGARSKNRPSSSSSAASLLPTASPGIGFGGYLGGSRIEPPSSSSKESTSFTEVDSELAQHLKRLSRKDPTTKLKALSSLCLIFKEKSGEEIMLIVPQWVFEYKRLLLDYNREVRRATHDTMTSLVIAVRKGLAPHLKSLMGPWWFSQFDPIPEVSQAAKRSFEVSFPSPERRLDSLMLYVNEIFLYLDENLKLTPQAISDKATPVDELEDTLQRVISSSLLAVATLVDILLTMKLQSHDSENVIAERKLFSKAKMNTISSAENMFSMHKFFLEFMKSKRPAIRSATYLVLMSFIKHVPQVYNEGNMKTLSTAILGAFQEKDASCHSSMWDVVILFSRKFPEAWSVNNIQKVALSRLWNFLKHGCYGSKEISYPALVVFLESVPPNQVEGEKFILPFFQNLWAGRSPHHSAAKDTLVFFKAFKECFLWALYNASRYSMGADAINSLPGKLVKDILVALLWQDYLLLDNSKSNDESLFKRSDGSAEETSQLLHERLIEKASANYPLNYVQELGRCIVEILSDISIKEISLLSVFCTSFVKDCLEMFLRGEYSLKFSERVERVANFFQILGHHAFQKEQSWPLQYLAGPILSGSFLTIKSIDSPDAVRILSVFVEIFGPVTILSYLHGCNRGHPSVACIDDNNNESKTQQFLQMFTDDFVPWCLCGLSRSSSAKLDLLIALVQDEYFSEQWSSIITLATSLVKCSQTDLCTSDVTDQIQVLAMLIEKVREKMSIMKIKNMQNFRLFPDDWQHELLDSVAISIALHSSSISHVQFLHAVLGGSLEDDRACFISKEAVINIYDGIMKNLVSFVMTSPFGWARMSSSLLLPPSEALIQAQETSSVDKLKMAQFSFDVLEGTVSCLTMFGDACTLLPSVLAVIFIIDWECSMASAALASHITEYDHQESCKQGQLITKLTLGKRIHAFLSKISASFLRCLSANNLSRLRNILVQTVRSAVFETNNISTGQISSLCCTWVLDLLEVICHDQTELQSMLDQLLSKDRSWPKWAASDFQDGSRSSAVQDKETYFSVNEVQHYQFVAFVDKLISNLGVSKVIAGSVPGTCIAAESVENVPLYARAWLASELLCTWNWPGGSVLDSFLPALSKYAESEISNSEVKVTVSIVNVLFSGALSGGICSKWISFDTWIVSDDELEKIQDAYLRALVSLLSLFVKDNVWRKQEALMFFEHMIDKLFETTTVNRTCLRILPFVMSLIIKPLLLQSTEFDETSKDILLAPWKDDVVLKSITNWLEKALSFPPLCIELTERDREEWLQVIISCYPLSAIVEPGTFRVEVLRDISHIEKSLLLSLFRKQRCDVASSVPDGMSSASSSNGPSISSRPVQMVLAKLMAVSVGYCWKEFSLDDWNFVLDNLDKWVESSVLSMEDIVEKVDEIVMNYTGNVEPVLESLEEAVQALDPTQISTSSSALLIFSLLSQFLELNEARNFEVLMFIKLERWDQVKGRLMENVLRLFFAAGTAQAIASSCSEEASFIIASKQLQHLQLWGRVSSFVINSPHQVRNAALKSMELWGLSKGPISSLYSILFCSKPISSLQYAAYRLLVTEPICYKSVFKENNRDVDVISSQDSDLLDNFGSPSEGYFCLLDEISYLIEKPSSELLELDVLSQDRMYVFLAWAIFLSHLDLLPSSSSKRERLIQYVQERASSTILDCIFQNIPLKLGTNNQKKKDFELVAEASRAAKAAKNIVTHSVLLNVESFWPVGTEQMAVLAGSIYAMMIRLLPSYVGNWFNSLRDRSLSSAIESFTKGWCSPSLISNELSQVKEAVICDENFSLVVNKSAYEIIATYKKEETGMDLVICLPSCYPLRPVEVDCTRSLGISELKKRKWLLSLTAFLRNQNGAIGEAIRVWKSNLDKEFLGVEECPICYSIIHTTNHSLPRLACKTCKHKFHSACLYKWFSTSHKSTCPLCQTPF